MTETPVAHTMRAMLEQALAPEKLEIRDDSHRHIGHAGHDGRGESHFHITIVSERFRGIGPAARHRMVYGALGDLLNTRIHALSIKAMAPQEKVP